MSRQISTRLPDDLYARLAEQARRERRTISNLVIALLSEAVKLPTKLPTPAGVSESKESGDAAL